jgi:hypothetical protein
MFMIKIIVKFVNFYLIRYGPVFVYPLNTSIKYCP